MKTWQELRESDIRHELLDDQYGVVGTRDTASNEYPDALVTSLGFAKSSNPDITKILQEELN